MSRDITARALIGVCLTHQQIFKTERVKTFEHNHPDSIKFDPQTGRPLWRDRERCILLSRDENYVVGCDTSVVEPKKALGGLYLFHDRSGFGRDEMRYLLGDFAVEDGEYRHQNFVALHTLDTHRVSESIRKVLQPHGLWDETQFGLWVVLYNAI